MSHSPLELLRHIWEEIEYLSSSAEGLTKERFLHDETLKRSFVRSVEIIGASAIAGIGWRRRSAARPSWSKRGRRS
jgi:uncharacterized protein with HEPN domain